VNPEQQERAIVLLDAMKQIFDKQKKTAYAQNVFNLTANYDDIIMFLEDVVNV
jgi:hypothetical protein